MTKQATTADRLKQLYYDAPGGNFGVFTPDGISVKYLPTLELAQELADLMSRKHHKTYTAKVK